MTELLERLTLVDLVGSIGTLMVVAAYFLTQARLLAATGLAFPLINLCGSGLIALSLSRNFNLASALMEFFWVGISLLGIVQALRERSRRIGP
ncbi:MAG: hypothetical protein DI532_19195 [Azospirillum brasilense]|uniref:CBU-0592-like domain-containing protein n=1 Tax=Roseomonas gilardii TaxID=257708 RepID=A0A1L7AJ40_9PROT|nr:hypothetical protein [Roseomonas gilardii]APT58807.1 hypothetical protein RGI145_18525 [Roseomonas gilardii]PZR10118.1 MAG: hypothetical protein DI532_19195 [Azospirillum brasilense]